MGALPSASWACRHTMTSSSVFQYTHYVPACHRQKYRTKEIPYCTRSVEFGECSYVFREWGILVVGERNPRAVCRAGKMLSLSQTLGLRSKKKFHFDVSFTLQDLVNCTYVTGVIFAKLRLKDGGSFTEVSRR